MNYYRTINYEGQTKTLKLEIGYEEHGTHFPATRETPEEFPELEVKEVYFEETDIYEILTDEQIEEITNKLNEQIYE